MKELDYLFSPTFIRDGAHKIFEETIKGQTHFTFHPEKLSAVVEFVMETIKEKYPDFMIPFHSRWGHFRPVVERADWLNEKISHLDALEKARVKWDLVIVSVLLDAGAGPDWSYFEQQTQKSFSRSEGLGIASFHMFMSQAFSSKKMFQSDAEGLMNVTPELIEKYFQVTKANPLVGVEGRAALLKNLGQALKHPEYFANNRPGGLIDYLLKKNGPKLKAKDILRAVLDALGPIWPGRETFHDVNLGDVWKHSTYGLVGFHKLSQWMTYSLIEPLIEAEIEVSGVEELTGLPEYRNGGLLLDLGLLSFKDEALSQQTFGPEHDVIIEWRALTVYLLDQIGQLIQKQLGKSAQEFPLAKVLEGGTWWAGRKIAALKRAGGIPPLNIKSDATVF
jgi:Protein of unknown function (DUF1688)